MLEVWGRRIRKLSCVAVFALFVVNAAFAGPFEDAIAAGHRGDYSTAIKLLRPLADQGDVVAQFNIGISYKNGFGVPKDEGEAIKWFRKAGDRGYANDQNSLAVIYETSKQYAKAAFWYRKAAQQGFTRAQNS